MNYLWNNRTLLILAISLVFLLIICLYEEKSTQSTLSQLSFEVKEQKRRNEEHFHHLRKPNSLLELSDLDLPVANTLNLAPKMVGRPEACQNSVLWGREHHGGWYICKDYIPVRDCIVYSFGLGADWSFDNEAEKNNCQVHGFDPTNSLWKQGMHGKEFSGFDYAREYPSGNNNFHNWGIGAVNTVYPPGTIPQDWPGLGDPPMSKTNPDPWEVKSLEKTIHDLGHQKAKISILKIDIEGAEWATLMSAFYSDFMINYLKNGFIEQLLLEFHWDPQSSAQNERYAGVMRRIEEYGFVPWKIERHEGSDCCLDVSDSYVWKAQ